MQTIEQEQVLTVPTSKVHISPLNTRQPKEKDVKASGLIDSIKEGGQLTPGLGRPHPDKPDEIELAAGARRLVACTALGIDYRVIVREIPDGEFEDIILTENLQREDPDPEAEADLIQRRLDEGMSPGEIASRYGKTEMWVKRRLKIAAVIPELRKQFAPGEDLEHYTTQMKERLGALSKEEQKRVAKDPWCYADIKTFEHLCTELASQNVDLKGCDWLDDPDTAKDGCGPGCATNSKNDLFADPQCKEGACQNSACFNFRRGLAINKAITAALGDTPMEKAVFFVTSYMSGCDYKGKSINYLQSWDFPRHYKKSKKKTELIGIDITDPVKPKTVFLEKVQKGGGAAGKAAPGTNKPKESREDRLTGKRLAAINGRIVKSLEKADVPTTVPILTLTALFGTKYNNTHTTTSKISAWNFTDKKIVPPLTPGSNKTGSIESVLWQSIQSVIRERLMFCKNNQLLDKAMRTEMEKVAWLIGFDYAAAWKEICTKEITVPKSWGPGIDPVTLKAETSKAKKQAKKATKTPAKKAAKKAAKTPKKKAAKAKKKAA